MEARPQTPQALVVYSVRARSAAARTPAPVTDASTMLKVGSPSEPSPLIVRIDGSSSRSDTTPSDTRKPATRSKSSPGVRIVTLNRPPLTRTSSGSSSATESWRAPPPPSSRTCSTRRLTAVRMRG